MTLGKVVLRSEMRGCRFDLHCHTTRASLSLWLCMSRDHFACANFFSVVATMYFVFLPGQLARVLLILGALGLNWLLKSCVCELIAGGKTTESQWWQRTDWRWSWCAAGLTVWVHRHHFQALMTFITPKCKYANRNIVKILSIFFFLFYFYYILSCICWFIQKNSNLEENESASLYVCFTAK